jgi:hypothetical protein
MLKNHFETAVILGGGLTAFAVVLLTTGTIAARAASSNPIHSLKYEWQVRRPEKAHA